MYGDNKEEVPKQHLYLFKQQNYVCVCLEDQKWAWFILKATLNQANGSSSDLIFIGNAVLVP